jgi:hypothetical protein
LAPATVAIRTAAPQTSATTLRMVFFVLIATMSAAGSGYLRASL